MNFQKNIAEIKMALTKEADGKTGCDVKARGDSEDIFTLLTMGEISLLIRLYDKSLPEDADHSGAVTKILQTEAGAIMNILATVAAYMADGDTKNADMLYTSYLNTLSFMIKENKDTYLPSADETLKVQLQKGFEQKDTQK